MNISTKPWLDSINSALQATQSRQGLVLKFTFDDVKLQSMFEEITSGDLHAELLHEFVSKMFRSEVEKQYKLRTSRALEHLPERTFEGVRDEGYKQYMPIIMRGNGSYLDGDTPFDRMARQGSKRPDTDHYGKMRRGWDKLWGDIGTVMAPKRSGDDISVGMGPYQAVMAHRLSHYMPVQGAKNAREPNTLFKAVEFGTGVAENVGGAQWVRKDGPTKESDGSWWLGPTKQQGAHFFGQKGFHFLYEERTRKPKEFYYKFIYEKFPEFVDDYLKNHDKFGGRVVRV